MCAHLRIADELSLWRANCYARRLRRRVTKEHVAVCVEIFRRSKQPHLVRIPPDQPSAQRCRPVRNRQQQRSEGEKLHHLAAAYIVIALPLNGEVPLITRTLAATGAAQRLCWFN